MSALDILLRPDEWYAPRVWTRDSRERTRFQRTLVYGEDLDSARTELAALHAEIARLTAALAESEEHKKALRKDLNEAIRDQQRAAQEGFTEGRWAEREEQRDW